MNKFLLQFRSAPNDGSSIILWLLLLSTSIIGQPLDTSACKTITGKNTEYYINWSMFAPAFAEAKSNRYKLSGCLGEPIIGASYNQNNIAYIGHVYLYQDPLILSFKLAIDGMFRGDGSIIDDTLTAAILETEYPHYIVCQGEINTNGGKVRLALEGLNTKIPYYLAVTYRNALETWSRSPQFFYRDSLIYDFTSAKEQAYGNNLTYKNNKWCLYNGDVNRDGLIDFSDIVMLDNAANGNSTGFQQMDLTGDNIVNNSDLNICIDNAREYAMCKNPVGNQRTIWQFRKKGDPERYLPVK